VGPSSTAGRRKTSLARGLALVAAALATVSAGEAVAQEAEEGLERTLVDRELRAQSIRLLSISNGSIEYEDESGRRMRGTVAGIVAMAPEMTPPDPDREAPDARRARKGYIELTDGQRFPGEPGPTAGEEDAVVWSHPLFGTVRFGLDSVARVVLDRAVLAEARVDPLAEILGPQRAPVEDELTLANGDRLSGFLLSLGDPVEIEVDGSVLSIPRDRVASARLANPREPLAGLVVWLEDGAVAVVASLEGQVEEGLRLRLASGEEAETTLSSLKAIAFEAGRLRPLASLEVIDERAIGRRTLLSGARIVEEADEIPGEPAALDAPTIELPGAMSVRWRLPEGARRVGFLAELPLDALPWGDLELVVEVDGIEAMRERLFSESRIVEASMPLDAFGEARELSVRVEPGRHGPVGDRVLIRRGTLLID